MTLNSDQFFRFDKDPDFSSEDSLLRKKDDGSQTAMSYVDTPHGRFLYDVRTSPEGFNVSVEHKGKLIGNLYGPIGQPEEPNNLPIGEVSVHSKYGRRGLATQMLRLARQNMPEGVNIVHSTELTPRGAKWVEGLKKKGID